MSARAALPVFTLVLLAVPATARASDPAAAQALFDQAKQLVDDRHYAEACPKFAESQQLDPGIGTEFHLADCWQRIGRTASAWALFRQVESEASSVGQVSRARVAHDRASALEPLLSQIQVDPNAAANTPGIGILRDGAPLSRQLWGVPVPVDPGVHTVTVQAPNKQPWQTQVDVGSNGNVSRVDVPLLADAAPPAPLPPPPIPPPATLLVGRPGVTQAMPSSETPVLQNRGSGQRALGWFFIGAGVVGLGLGTYFGVTWLNDKDSDNPSQVANAQNQRTYFEIAGGTGLGCVILGTILVGSAASPRVVTVPTTMTSRLEVRPIVGPGVGGLALHGGW